LNGKEYGKWERFCTKYTYLYFNKL
jgi:hypothetical protein